MWRSVPASFTQPGLRSAFLLALALAILPPPPPASSPTGPRGAADVVRAIAGVYRKRSANQRVQTGRLVGEDGLGTRGVGTQG